MIFPEPSENAKSGSGQVIKAPSDSATVARAAVAHSSVCLISCSNMTSITIGSAWGYRKAFIGRSNGAKVQPLIVLCFVFFATQMTASGHSRRFDHVRDESGLPPIPDILRIATS